MVFDVVTAVLIDPDSFMIYRQGTTYSLILNFIYSVTPSVLYSAYYLINY